MQVRLGDFSQHKMKIVFMDICLHCTKLVVWIFGGQSTVPPLWFFGILFCYFEKTCVEQLKKHDHQSFERVCKESEVCKRKGRNCLNVSKLLVNNTKNLSSDYNLGHCTELLQGQQKL